MFWDHVVNMVNMVTQVMMINMVNMRRTYPAFLEHTLTNDEMYWPGYVFVVLWTAVVAFVLLRVCLYAFLYNFVTVFCWFFCGMYLYVV